MTTTTAPLLQHGRTGLDLVLCPDWESLCASLGGELAEPPADPFASQLVVCDAPATRRALSQQLAGGGPGISAGIDFLGLRGLRRRLDEALLGIDAGHDAWRSRGLALAVVDVLDEVGSEDWMAPVLHHLGAGAEQDRPGRRLATASRIARLQLRYCRTAPDLVRAWNQGLDVGADGAALPGRSVWQPRLWRLVRERLGPLDPVSRQDALAEALASASVRGLAQALGDQVLRVVEPVPCPPLDRELLASLSAVLPVGLWMLAPAQAEHPLGRQWDGLRLAAATAFEQFATRVHRPAAAAVPAPGTLGCLQSALGRRGTADPQPVTGPGAGAPGRRDPDHDVAHHTLLRHDVPGPDVVDPDVPDTDAPDRDVRGLGTPDGSVQVHASHGPDRQVEVLREVLCGLFADDPTLEPRDVVVACTDLDVYAPLVRAAFCLDPDVVGRHLHPGHRLRVQLADSSLAQPNQVLETLRMLLHLAGDRATAQDLVDLCSSAPVATRFALGEDELERIHRLVRQADVRWGLDQRHRAGFGLGQVGQSTWLAGINRVLAGVAMGPRPLAWLGTALPVEQVDSSDVMAAGILAEVVSRTRKLVADWREPAPIGEWTARLHEALDLLVAAEGDDAWQLTQARSELADLADLALDRTARLTLHDVHALFGRLLRTGRGRPSFGNGSLMVCGLDDLGQVAHRVVCVLGLDDQRFPSRPGLDGDDLVPEREQDPQTDLRARSRQQLLDALNSARERFVVVHQGFTPRTNEPVPQPVAVLDLLEACREHGGAATARHTLQPQAAQNFHAAPGEAPFSFDLAALAGAQARELLLDSPAAAPPPLWQVPLDNGSAVQDPAAAGPLDLVDLVDFLRHPARELLRRRLGVTMGEYPDELSDRLPVEPGGLQEWQIGDRMVQLALSGLDPQRVAAAERLRGELPPGNLGSRTLDKLMPLVQRVVEATLREQQPGALDLDCELPLQAPGQRLTGRVRVHGSTVVSLAFSWTSAPHLLRAWCQLLLLAATQPAPPLGWRAVHVGRDAIATLTAPPPEQCGLLLREMVALRTAGLEQLVPLPVKAAATFTRATPLRPFRDHDPERKAAREFHYEHDADWARFVPDDFEALRRIPPLPEDPGIPGPSRFENLAEWLFGPVREHLAVGNLR